jgi:hypothetical protein
VTALRPDQEALLAEHRERGAERLAAVIAGTPLGDPRHSPEGEVLLKDDPGLLVSVAVCVVAADRDAAERGHGEAIWITGRSAVPTMLLRALRPRRLPWTPRDAELLLDLSAGISVVNMEFAVAVARRVLAAHPADRGVQRALEAAGIALEGMDLGGGARVRALRERIVGDEVVRPKSSKRPSADPVRAFGAALLDELAARGFTDRKGREAWRFFPDRVEAVSARSERGAPLVDVGVAFEAARHGLLGCFKVYFCDFRGMARLGGDVDVDTAVTRTLGWFERWQAPAVVDFVLSEAGVVELDGFETSGPRGLDTPAANVLVGYLADAAGRPELRQPCLERAAELYRDVLDRTEPRDEELATLVARLEADAAT